MSAEPRRKPRTPRLPRARYAALVSLPLIACLPCSVPAAPFALLEGNGLGVRWGDTRLIAGDSLTMADQADAERREDSGVNGWAAVTVVQGGSRKRCTFYREVGLRPDRVEVTWYAKYAPYLFGSDLPGHTYNTETAAYEVRVPVEALAGAQYDAVVGSVLKPTRKTGVLRADLAEGTPIEDKVWYLSFRLGERGVTFDLNPLGAHSLGNKMLFSERDWSLAREGEFFVLRARMRRLAWGDTRQFKLVVLDGALSYDDIHSAGKRGSPPLLYPTLRASFGRRPLKRHIAVGASPYSPDVGAGWLESPSLELVATDMRRSIYREQVCGRGRGTLQLDAKDGLYVLSLLTGSPAGASEPFEVAANGEPKLHGLATGPGEFSAKSFSAWARGGRMLLTFTGPKWLLSGLSLTPLAYASEDYFFDRSWFIKQDQFDEWFRQVEPLPDLPAHPARPARGGGMDWTWNTVLTTFEGSLDSSRTALDTPETTRQRLKLLQSGGFRGLIVGGQHFRFNHAGTVRHRVLLRNTRLAAEEAHRLGMKIVDHWDFNWVFGPGYPLMLKLLAEDPDCLQRSADLLQVSTSFCLNSETFMKVFTEYLQEHQRATNVDGHMIDEVNWVKAQFCFCDTCRHRFQADTGLRLPLNPYDVVKKWDDPVWRALVRWRGRRTAATHGRLRRAMQEIRPDTVMMRYTSTYFSYPHPAGLELNQNRPWNADYVGDEFHPDVVLQNWRVIMARMRNRQGAVASWGNAPTWILPKFNSTPGRTLYAWALGRMNRANVWYRSGDYELSNRLNCWEHQMQDRVSAPLSDVAVLLSQYSRDVSGDVGYYFEEHMAWLQTMAEENVQLDVILDRDLKPARLEPYSTLLLPNTAVLSDEQAGIIRDFAAGGGWVVASYETGFRDTDGEPRARPALAADMNLQFTGQLLKEAMVTCAGDAGPALRGLSFHTTAPQHVAQLVEPSRSRVVAGTPAPAIVRTPCGKGGFLYLAGNFVRQNFEPRAVSARNRTTLKGRFAYKADFNRDLNRLVKGLLTECIGDRAKTRSVRMPRGVIYTAFRETSGDAPAIVLHLLNCQGKNDLAQGAEVELPIDVPQPPVDGELILQIASDQSILDAYFAAPLDGDSQPVVVSPDGGNRWLVHVPEGALKNYGIVRLKLSSGRPQ